MSSLKPALAGLPVIHPETGLKPIVVGGTNKQITEAKQIACSNGVENFKKAKTADGGVRATFLMGNILVNCSILYANQDSEIFDAGVGYLRRATVKDEKSKYSRAAWYVLGLIYMGEYGDSSYYNVRTKWRAPKQAIFSMQKAAMFTLDERPKAEEWWSLIDSDRKVVIQARKAIGDLYWRGEGIFQEPVLAYMWYSLAAYDSGDIRDRDKIAKQMDSSQVNRARSLAKECLKSKFLNCDGIITQSDVLNSLE